jgi:DNA-directed RNA polymerase subunit RPC12/RpoP
MSTIMVAEYLDENESAVLSDKLKTAGMSPIVKRHGLPRLFGTMANYKVFVDATDSVKAKEITEAFKLDCIKQKAETDRLRTTQCPTCGSKQIGKAPKLSLVQKIRFIGVTVWRCNECGNEWYS